VFSNATVPSLRIAAFLFLCLASSQVEISSSSTSSPVTYVKQPLRRLNQIYMPDLLEARRHCHGETGVSPRNDAYRETGYHE